MNKTAKILLVDDDETICETLSMALETEGYKVETAKTGKAAIAKTNENVYNVAIVDWRLPDVDGTALLGKMKDTKPKMAKIMLTGYPSMSNAVEAVNNRADAFLIKPVDISLLLEKIRALLKEQEQEKAYSQDRVAAFIESRTKEFLLNKKTQQ